MYVNHLIGVVQGYLSGSSVSDATGYDWLKPSGWKVTSTMEEGSMEMGKGDVPMKLKE